MVYQIVLKNNQVIDVFGDNMDNILDMIANHDIIIVPENKHPDHVTYIFKDDISYYRFPKDYKGVAKPVI